MPSADPPSSSALPQKPFSISFGSSNPKVSPSPAPRKRPHSALADQSDGEDEGQPATQLVSAFDQSGAIITNGAPTRVAPLIIQVEKNRDWREESRKKKKRKNLLPAEVQAAKLRSYADQKAAQIERDEVSRESGLSFISKDQDGDTTMLEGQCPQKALGQPVNLSKTADEEAMEALLGGEKKSSLVIPALGAGESIDEADYDDYADEDDRFKADVASRPDSSTLDDYASVPVDGFGTAMLRGMGWKEGDAVGKQRHQTTTTTTTNSNNNKPKLVERRPALLGIGAKEVPGGTGREDEFGAWGKALKGKGKRKTDLTYHPVILKNSRTGEMLTEEELAARKAEYEGKGSGKGEEDWRERRDKNLQIDQQRKIERRERNRLVLEDGRDGERSRDRSRSKERRRTHRRRSKDRSRRDRSRSGERSGYGFSRRRSRSSDRNHYHGSSRPDRSPYKASRHDRSRSTERRHGRY